MSNPFQALIAECILKNVSYCIQENVLYTWDDCFNLWVIAAVTI